jgi:hypothetical protein
LHVLYILADDFVHYLLYTAESPVFLIHWSTYLEGLENRG